MEKMKKTISVKLKLKISLQFTKKKLKIRLLHFEKINEKKTIRDGLS